MGKLAHDERIVRAQFDDNTVRVYQAYSPRIADYALESQTFGVGFKLDRMTWIKPSFCWMMYRSGFASKENQERVLGIDLTRVGFEWALEKSVLSSSVARTSVDGRNDPAPKAEPVRIQWDPESAVLPEVSPHGARFSAL